MCMSADWDKGGQSAPPSLSAVPSLPYLSHANQTKRNPTYLRIKTYRWLGQRPERNVAVVSHGSFLVTFFERGA